MLLLIPLLPLAGFLVNAFFGRRLSKALSGGVACAAMIDDAFLDRLAAMIREEPPPTPHSSVPHSRPWRRSGTVAAARRLPQKKVPPRCRLYQLR